MTKNTKLPKIKSLLELNEAKYHNLAIVSAQNLGGWNITDFDSAYRWLVICAQDTDEDDVVAEVNFCR